MRLWQLQLPVHLPTCGVRWGGRSHFKSSSLLRSRWRLLAMATTTPNPSRATFSCRCWRLSAWLGHRFFLIPTLLHHGVAYLQGSSREIKRTKLLYIFIYIYTHIDLVLASRVYARQDSTLCVNHEGRSLCTKGSFLGPSSWYHRLWVHSMLATANTCRGPWPLWVKICRKAVEVNCDLLDFRNNSLGLTGNCPSIFFFTVGF